MVANENCNMQTICGLRRAVNINTSSLNQASKTRVIIHAVQRVSLKINGPKTDGQVPQATRVRIKYK